VSAISYNPVRQQKGRLRAQILRLIAIVAVTVGGTALGQGKSAAPGLKVGEKIPPLIANDQFGRPQNFEALCGSNGLLLLFSRSADWCPYCKRQLLQLQAARAQFEAKGIKEASVTYDSEAILRDFAARKGISYPMLSDPGSRIIRAFGILNPDAKGFAAGIPYPGFYFISPQGVIVKRFFEAQYTDRFTPNGVFAEIFGSGALPSTTPDPIKNAHVLITLSQSDTDVGAGNHVKLSVELHPAAHVHLYAPGAEKNGYKVATLRITPTPEYRVEPVRYPEGSPFTFTDLHETVPVYSSTTVLSTDIVLSTAKEFTATIGSGKRIRIEGGLFYQACDDHQCFLPVEQPLSWEVNVMPFDIERSPEAIRHKE
jgi:peroxiredoxin